MKRFVFTASVFVAGGIVGAVIVLAMVGRSAMDEERVRKAYNIKYTKEQEARLGIECNSLKGALRSFIQTELSPVLDRRQTGQGWKNLISDDIRAKVSKQRDYLRDCGSLYLNGRRGEWNGLQDLAFTTESDQDIITVNTLVQYGEPKTNCDASCFDRNFSDLRNAVKRMEARVR